MSTVPSIEHIGLSYHDIHGNDVMSSLSPVSDRSSSPQLMLDSSPAGSIDSFNKSSSTGNESPLYSSSNNEEMSNECLNSFSNSFYDNFNRELSIEELFAQLDLFKFFESELCLEDRARIVISLIPNFLESPYAFRPHSGTKPEEISNGFNATIALVFDVLSSLKEQSDIKYQAYVQAIQESPFQVNDILRFIALGTYSSPIHYFGLPFPVLNPTSNTEIFSFLTTKFESLLPFVPSTYDPTSTIDYNISSNSANTGVSNLTSTIEASLTVSPDYSEFSFFPTSLDPTSTISPFYTTSPKVDSAGISDFLQDLVPLPNCSSIEDDLLKIDNTQFNPSDIDLLPLLAWSETLSIPSKGLLPKPTKPTIKKTSKSYSPKKPSKPIDPSRRIVECPNKPCWHRYTHTSGVKYHLEKCEFRPGVVRTIKPHPCPVPGCRKSYKSTSGRKYHLKKFHNEYLEDSSIMLSDDEDTPSKGEEENDIEENDNSSNHDDYTLKLLAQLEEWDSSMMMDDSTPVTTNSVTATQ